MKVSSIVIFASGTGSNTAAILEYSKNASFKVSAIITDKGKANVCQVARMYSIPLMVIEKNKEDTRQMHEEKILKELRKLDFNLIVLAGYNRILSHKFLDEFPEKSILNIHPSILPNYPGLKAMERIWHSKEEYSGVTIHYVNGGVDTGPVIYQETFSLKDRYSLEALQAKTQEIEHRSYPKIIEQELNVERAYRVEVLDFEKIHVYKIKTSMPLAKFQLLAPNLFSDVVSQKMYFRSKPSMYFQNEDQQVFEISYKSGVTDNRANAIYKICSLDENFSSIVLSVETARLENKPNYNSWIENVKIYSREEFETNQRFESIDFANYFQTTMTETLMSLDHTDEELLVLSKEKLWALSLDELKFIRDHFNNLKRNPTDVEMEIIAQSWSEHCKHKIFNAHIIHTDDDQKIQVDSLYKTYIKGATNRVIKEQQIDWTRSVFTDNAGIVRWDSKLDVCIKVETHNSPSALDPFAGALTGILGVNRDILGCGLGAKPIANTSVFCLPPEDAADEINSDHPWPSNIHHPRYLKENVHRGVADGGNKSGIPTVNGAFSYHYSYRAKPLVYCGTIGILPRKIGQYESHEKNQKAGDCIFMVGGRVGKDGIHGATFSSLELTQGTPSSVVQMGDPMMQKRLTDFILAARDQLLFSSITDNGAGGLSSSVGEMAQACNGAIINLELVPLKYQGLSLSEIIISESQERMTCAVNPDKELAFLSLAKEYGVEATAIGKFTNHGNLEVRYNERVVAKLDLNFLFNQLPPLQLQSTWSNFQQDDFYHQFDSPQSSHLQKVLLLQEKIKILLSSGNIKSHEKYVRGYDHEVGAATVVKPFAANGGPSDAAMLSMKSFGGGDKNGLVISCGLATLYNHQDPKVMAYYAVDEAVRNALCTGADIKKMALVDNFCWPNPLPHTLSANEKINHLDAELKLGALVRTCQGLYHSCSQLGLPLVSGKDSMKNDTVAVYENSEKKISISPTLLITSISHCADINQKLYAKYNLHDDLWLILPKQNLVPVTLHYLENKKSKYSMDHADLQKVYENYLVFQDLIKHQYITGAHDVSEGGTLICLIEMAINSNLGFRSELNTDIQYFGEGLGMIVFSANAKYRHLIKSRMMDAQRIGEVTADEKIYIDDLTLDINSCRAWYKGEC